MMVLIIGPNGSGKSAAAERIAGNLHATGEGGHLMYLATFVPADDDGQRRIERHRVQRADMGFMTVESPSGTFSDGWADVVLLEDVSNLLAHATFVERAADPVVATLSRIEQLQASCRHIVVVSIGGLGSDPGFDSETLGYIDALQQVNSALRSRADQVVDTANDRSPEVHP